MSTTSKPVTAPGIVLRTKPDVYLTALPGPWLLAHSTPSWRISDPQKGFQRIVKEERAKEIARTVLDTQRSFPNAITLATRTKNFHLEGGEITFPAKPKFLVVDGQHRLWAQHFSKRAGVYSCILHMDRSEAEMAALFLEINDNQRRVPSSLRWDLVRLVRHDDHPTVMTADIVYELATRKASPFYSVGIDLTGEKKDVAIKQGSLAPEIRTLIAKDRKRKDTDVEDYLSLLIRFFTAIRSLDSEGWGTSQSTFFKARVLRALLRVLSDIMAAEPDLSTLTTESLREHFERIDPNDLSEEGTERLVRVAMHFAETLSVSSFGIAGCGVTGTRAQIQRRLVKHGAPALVTQSALLELLDDQ